MATARCRHCYHPAHRADCGVDDDDNDNTIRPRQDSRHAGGDQRDEGGGGSLPCGY
jgi:hypothetical protein